MSPGYGARVCAGAPSPADREVVLSALTASTSVSTPPERAVSARPAPGGPADSIRTKSRRPALALVRSYIALTKPRIIEQLLISTVPVMLLAERGLPSVWLVLATLVGGTFAAGSANTFNCYIDRDIDQVMGRTRQRPLVRASITPTEALWFGLLLGVAATMLFGFAVNWVSALLADGAIAFYVFVYTLGLKRRTPSNIVIGGAAGCFPVLIGWSAVTGTVGWPAVLLFAVIFFWTPPHFWALAIRYREDYAAAGIPMLPVVASPAVVTRRMLGYSYLMVAASLLLVPVADPGWTYLVVAALLGGWFLVEAHRLVWRVHRGGEIQPMRLFHMSITYLTLLFVGLAVSALTI